MPRVTREEIEAARSPRGGWSKATLASWGIPWPPPKGWRKRLEGRKPSEPPQRRARRRELQPGDLHPAWPEWRWDGEKFTRA